MRYIYFIFLFCLWSPFCSSAVYSKVIGTGTGSSNNIKIYDFIIDAWTDDPSPNPCYGKQTCAIAIDHRHTNAGVNGENTIIAGWYSSSLPCIVSSVKMTDLRDCMLGQPATYSNVTEEVPSNKGVPFTLPYRALEWHRGNPVTQECVGLFWASKFGNQTMHLLPGSVCGIVPPPIGACGMSNNIEIDHGSLPVSAVDGNLASTTFPVDCNKKVSIKFYVRGLENDRLPLNSGSGIYSQLTLNDNLISEQGVVINLLQGENILKLNSKLISDGKVISGEHKGQGVLIMTIE